MGLFDDLIPQQQRAPVSSTAKVWGDSEAEAAGLYEPSGGTARQLPGQPGQPRIEVRPRGALSFDDLIPSNSSAQSVVARFPAEQPQNEALQAQLQGTARAMTTGAPTSQGTKIGIDFANSQAAAGQRTTPNIDAQYKNLVSDQTFESDAGEVLFRDPVTGKVMPTDQNKHVALRDPADNRVKIFARTESTDEGALSAGGRLMMSGMGAGAATARPSIGVAAAKEVQPAASDIFSTAKPFYRAFKNEAGGIEVPPETASGFGLRIKDALDKANLIPELAPPVFSAIGIFDRGEGLTLASLQNIKRVVGRGFNSPDKNIRDAAAVASGEIGKIISEVSQTAGQNLKTADAIHSTARSVQDLQRKGAVADLRAGRAGYGGNAVNSMRQVLSPIVQRAVEGKNTGFKPDEIQAMREIVEGTTATNALRLAGQASPTKGIMNSGLAAHGGYLASGGVGAAVIPALGAASNKVATILTGRQIDRLKELVAKRSPAYADAVAKATQRYENAQMDLVNKPTPAKFAAYLSASRALSAGFQRDGIQVSSGELLRAIQGGSMKAAADDDEQPVDRVGNQ
jgi:hypothetical protein